MLLCVNKKQNILHKIKEILQKTASMFPFTLHQEQSSLLIYSASTLDQAKQIIRLNSFNIKEGGYCLFYRDNLYRVVLSNDLTEIIELIKKRDTSKVCILMQKIKDSFITISTKSTKRDKNTFKLSYTEMNITYYQECDSLHEIFLIIKNKKIPKFCYRVHQKQPFVGELPYFPIAGNLECE